MTSQPSPTPMSEPNAVPVSTPMSPGVPVTESDNGSTTQPTPAHTAVPLPPTMPTVSITFLVISGNRRTMSFDPSLSVGRVKELVWLSWPSEWPDERPPAPNYLRILYLGKLLQDDNLLESIDNPLAPAPVPSGSPSATTPPNSLSMIMHLSVRPAPGPGDSDDLKKKRKRRRNTSAETGTPAGPEQAGESSSCCGGLEA